MIYNNILEAVGNTPLIKLNHIVPEGAAEVFVKNEGLDVGGSIGIGLKGGDNFRKNYLNPALRDGFLAMLYPDNPKRKGQAYYLTQKGLKIIEQKKED